MENLYYNGKIDIIIPYYNETKDQFIALKNNLLSQSIIDDCIIYLISDSSYMDQCVINIFSNEKKLHCVFLRNDNHDGVGAARQKGIDHSYNEYLFNTDVDDLFTISNALEQLYLKINEGYDLIQYNAYHFHDKFYGKPVYVIRRKFLEQYNIKYKNYFFAEDNQFNINLLTHVSKEKLYCYNNPKNLFLYFNATTNYNICSYFIAYDSNQLSEFVAGFLPFIQAYKNKTNIELLEPYLINWLYSFKIKYHPNDFTLNLIKITIFLFQQYEPSIIINNYIQELLKYRNIIIPNNIYNEKEYVIKYIEKNYLTDKFLAEPAKDLLNFLKSIDF